MAPRLRSYQTMKERGIEPPIRVPKPIRKRKPKPTAPVDDGPYNLYPTLWCDKCHEARVHTYVRRTDDRLIFLCIVCLTERGYGN